MNPSSLEVIAAATRGSIRPRGAGEVLVRGVEVDSRRVHPGSLFVALSGGRADGHRFVADAFTAGAAAALVVAGRLRDASGPTVEVPDTGRALLALARHERGRMDAIVVGITGSTGKTCTKDLTAAVLAKRFRVVASPASFNNEVGLPLTLLSASAETEAMVCEMGSRGPGHVRLLCEVARPSVGVVTNVGVAHMELFGSPEVLRRAKAELTESLPPDGTAVLNADDPVVRSYAAGTRARVLWYGTGPEDQIRAEGVQVDRTTGRASFDLVTPAGRACILMPAPGEHLVPDALAAAAVGAAFEIDPEETAGAISAARISGGRMEEVRGAGGVRVINDAYNANPTSTAAALRAARWMAANGRCVAVLGVMAELGPIAVEEHERIGELVARLGFDALVVVGPEARRIAVGAEREGVEPARIVVCEGSSEAVEAVNRLAGPGDVVLVKGSRAARLERVVESLRAPAERLVGGAR